MRVKMGCYFEGDKPKDLTIDIEKGMRVELADENEFLIASFDPEEIKALYAIVKEICG